MVAASQSRVRFPIWLKLGLFFGAMVGLAVSAYGWHSHKAEVADEIARHKAWLMGHARALAAIIDGDVHATFQTSKDAQRAEFQAIRRRLAATVAAAGLRWAGTLTRDEKGRWSYVIDSEESDPLPLGYPYFDANETTRAVWGGKVVLEGGIEDEWGRYDAASAPIRNTAGQVVAIVEVDSDADVTRLLLRRRTRSVLMGIGLTVLMAFLGAVLFSRYINRHLGALTRSARQIAGGDLSQEVRIETRDEIGVLGAAFNDMTRGLREREFIRETFGRFVSPSVVDKVLTDPASVRLGGEERTVTVMMSDLRGFTALSESLVPEQMVALLNRYFSCMAEVIIEHGGTINELLGDGMLVLFGAPEAAPDDALRAVRCAVGMQRALLAFNEAEGERLEMGIGLETGPVIAGNIGSEHRMKYGVVGTVVNMAARIEGITFGGQVLISEPTRASAAALGALEVGKAVEFRPKGSRDPVRCFPVKRIDGVELPVAEEERGIRVDLPARWFTIDGKAVAADGMDATATLLSRKMVRLVFPAGAPTLHENVKLELDLPGGPLSDIYARVARAADDRHVLRFTSMPEEQRRRLDLFLTDG